MVELRRPLYSVDSVTFAALRSLDHVERIRYRELRRRGVPPQEALPLAREVEDPLPELGSVAALHGAFCACKHCRDESAHLVMIQQQVTR